MFTQHDPSKRSASAPPDDSASHRKHAGLDGVKARSGGVDRSDLGGRERGDLGAHGGRQDRVGVLPAALSRG